MHIFDIRDLTVIPARLVVTNADCVPPVSGIYLFFFRGGNRILSATSYFDLDGRPPLTIKRRQHLYTGAAENLRRRLKQHMAISNGSSLRRTLLAIELQRQAITRSKTPSCDVRGERSLTEWLVENAWIGLQPVKVPFERERRLLNRFASPLNLTLRRQQPYARALSQWRRTAFPSWDGGRLDKLRDV